MSHVIIVGGGAAGMMAGYAAAHNGHRVSLLEKNEKIGKKIYITGKGRCNITNLCEPDTFFSNMVSNGKFLYSSFHHFDNHHVIELIERYGCSLKTERGERVFPVSDHSSDVISAMQRALRSEGVEIFLHTEVKKLIFSEEAGEKTVIGVELTNGKKLYGDSVILATGGLSYPTTGSTGAGYELAKSVGHTITPCRPALVGFHIKEEWCKDLQGLSLKNIKLRLMIGGKKRYEGFGEMLFTHKGISGPLVLSASSYYGKYHKGEETEVLLDLKPALSEEVLDKRILRDFEAEKNKALKNALVHLYPSGLIPVVLQISGLSAEKKACEVSKEERSRLLKTTKNLPLHVIRTAGFEEAVITQGGVRVKEVNPSTMESKLCHGLYLAGELLDVDALTGGFNLQVAWSTGYLAGESQKE